MSIKQRALFLIWLVFAAVAAPVHAGEAEPDAPALSSPAASSDSRFSVSRGDKVLIEVYREPELSGTFIVNSTGYIKYPLLGELFLEGLTLDEISDYLTASLGEQYLVNPQVSVQVVESASKAVTLLGQVSKPGNYALTPGTALVRLISQAGGFGPAAISKEVSVTRTDRAGKKSVVTVNVDRIMKGEDADYPLETGDIVYVDENMGLRPSAPGETTKPSDDPSLFITLLGQISRPGNYYVAENLTLIRLIGQAGGFTPLAASGRVRIVRIEAGGNKRVFFVDCSKIIDGRSEDIPVLAGDIIFVPESFF